MNLKDARIAAKALNIDGGMHWTEEDHPRDEKGMFTASGNTFAVKEHLKAAGFQSHPATNTWFGTADDRADLVAKTRGVNKKDRERSEAIKALKVVSGDPRVSAPAPAAKAENPHTGRGNVDTDPYNRGAKGQRVFGQKHIRGSAPDDFE